MSPVPPFVDRVNGGLDTDQILEEAVPIAYLIGLFVAIALVPLAIALLTGGSFFGFLFSLIAQFVLAVGGGVVLLYVITRAIQLADELETGPVGDE